MKKTLVIKKISLLVVLVRTGVPLVLTGLLIGSVIGFLGGSADPGGANRWVAAAGFALVLGAQGLALALLITLGAAVYNLVASRTGGIRLKVDDQDDR